MLIFVMDNELTSMYIIFPFFNLGYIIHFAMKSWIMGIEKMDNADNMSSARDKFIFYLFFFSDNADKLSFMYNFARSVCKVDN